MPSDDLIHHPFQHFQVQPAIQRHFAGNVVERIVWNELIQEPQPLLRE
jgi:hypothetical protein